MRCRLGLLGRQPHRSGPRPGGAECHRRGHLPTRDNPARGQDRGFAAAGNISDRFEHLGAEDHRRHLTAVTARLGTLCDDQVDSGMHLLDGMFLGTYECRDRNAVLLTGFDHVVRGYAEGVGHQLDRVVQRHLEQVLSGIAGQRRGGDAHLFDRDVVLGQQFRNK